MPGDLRARRSPLASLRDRWKFQLERMPRGDARAQLRSCIADLNLVIGEAMVDVLQAVQAEADAEESGAPSSPAPETALTCLCPACESPEKWGDQHAPWCAAPAPRPEETRPHAWIATSDPMTAKCRVCGVLDEDRYADLPCPVASSPREDGGGREP